VSVIPYVNVLIIATASWTLWRKERSELRRFFIPALLFRVACGIALGLVYTYMYTVGDTFEYFDQGSRIAAMTEQGIGRYIQFLWSGTEFYSDGFEVAPRALFLSKITSIVVLLSGYNYWITTIYFSFAPFITSWVLVKELSVCRYRYAMPAVFALLFFPSAVFWSSGLIKESVAMSCLFFLVAVTLRLWRGGRVTIWQWILFLPAVWLLWGLKYYYLAVLLPVIFTELLMQRVIRPRLAMRPGIDVLVWLAVFMVPAVAASFVHPNFYPERFLEVVVSNYEVFERISDAGDMIVFPDLAPEVGSILKYAPRAVFSGLYRPFLWEASGTLQIISSLENALLVVLTLGFAFQKFKTRKVGPLFLPAIVYCVLLITFLALSAPNFGTLSRYRVGMLPFFVLLISSDNYFLNLLKALLRRR